LNLLIASKPAGGRLAMPELGRLGGAAVATIAAIWWIGGSAVHADTAVLTLTYLFIAIGIYLPYGLAGSLSVAYPAYINIGAYAVALVGTQTGWPVFVAVPIAFVASGIVAVLLGLVTARLTGFYLAAVTLLFSEAFSNFVAHSELFGGETGIQGVASPSFLSASISDHSMVVIAVIAAVLCTVALSRIRRSPLGVTLRAQREVPVAVGATGVAVPSLTLVSLGVGAGISSLAGCVFVLANHAIFPQSLTLELVFLVFFIPVLGGQDTPWGCVAGSVLVVGLTLGLGVSGQIGALLFALAVLLIIMVAPHGVFGLFIGAGERLRRAFAGISVKQAGP
jgi:branched-chain amino acid transport system permease protein